jgi:hypothetical protein
MEEKLNSAPAKNRTEARKIQGQKALATDSLLA